MREVIIYTDGACSGNPGPGGWAAVLIYGNHVRELNGGEGNTTNQRMELLAAINALRALKEPCQVKLYSDSAYLINCFKQGWYKKWLTNGWMTNNGPVKNRELWEELLRLIETHQVDFLKVKETMKRFTRAR